MKTQIFRTKELTYEQLPSEMMKSENNNYGSLFQEYSLPDKIIINFRDILFNFLPLAQRKA